MIFKDTSIQRKVTAVIMIISVAALMLAMTTLFIFEIKEFRQSLAREISSIADIVGANMTAALEFDDAASGQQILSALANDPRIVSAEVFSESGARFVGYTSGAASSSFLGDREISSSRSIMLRGKKIGSIVIRANSRQMLDRLRNYAMVLLLALVIAAIGAYALSSILRNLISGPILHLADVARKISQSSDYSIRAEKTSDDETGVLIDQFNNMLGQITRKSRELAESRFSLEQSEYQLRLITDSLPVLIAYIDDGYRYRFVNAAYEQWFHMKRDDLLGKTIAELWGDAVFATMKPYVDKVLSASTVTYEVALPGGEVSNVTFISETYIPDLNDAGTVEGFFALASDITDRKKQEEELQSLNSELEERVKDRTAELQRSQEQLRQSERLASIGTLAAGIAHEIRNPLNTISLATQYALKSSSSPPGPVSEVLQVVQTEAARCAEIIKNVLLFSKSEKTVKSPHDLNDVVKHALDIAKGYTKERFLVEIQTEKNPVLVTMNQTEIEQVIVNLISNALEASVSTPVIDIKLRDEGTKAALTVSDNGPGIPAELLNHIFDPFFSTKRQRGNTGLGLSLSHGIVAEHGGTMTVRSQVGKGTTFIIEFPKAEV